MMKPVYDIKQNKLGLIGRVKTITFAFFAVISVGTFLLMLPVAKQGVGSADLLTALFTATSATCVTGLSVVDTATYWSFWGRLIILALIQIGGLGVMMLGAIVALVVGRRISMGERILLSTSLNLDESAGIVRFAMLIIKGTFMLEGAGALLLTVCFIPEFGLWGALERGIFVSISAFCNAGFDNLGIGGKFASIIPYKNNIPILLIISCLIIVGGIGFYVWNEFNEVRLGKRKVWQLSLHTKLVLLTTIILLLGGTAVFFVTEFHGDSIEGGVISRLVQSFFQSVTVRTAGFDHIGQGELTSASRAVSMVLMFIGGSPGSVAGGIKTTTFTVLALSAVSALKGRKRIEIFGRSISEKAVSDAMSLFFLAAFSAFMGALVISMLEGIVFEAALFECISAIATVGLSMGLTPMLGTASKVLLVILMFLGRVGIITVGMTALMRSTPDESIKLPEGKVIIG
ncbi:MAG: Trk family potassium uptake protein [Clostridia bacterium]|nr:potassium uptake protein, TrkH family [Clostridia bacterium]MBQ5814131.1 Trk family potassium uptake protein [Clostridia bacterium]